MPGPERFLVVPDQQQFRTRTEKNEDSVIFPSSSETVIYGSPDCTLFENIGSYLAVHDNVNQFFQFSKAGVD